jgi:hypothetical protein
LWLLQAGKSKLQELENNLALKDVLLFRTLAELGMDAATAERQGSAALTERASMERWDVQPIGGRGSKSCKIERHLTRTFWKSLSAGSSRHCLQFVVSAAILGVYVVAFYTQN